MRYRAAGIPGEAAADPQLTVRNARERLAGSRLYVITPDAAPDRVLAVATAAERGGADVVQLRHKSLPRGELLALARRLRAALGRSLFIVNDHADIAVLAEADGVHVGPEDLSVVGARQVCGPAMLVGASASSIDAGRAAVAAGADYLGCGPAFPTPVKAAKKVIGPEGIAAIAAAIGPAVPVFAIGGIDSGNISELTGLGLRRACVIRAVGEAPDPEQAARTLRAMLDA